MYKPTPNLHPSHYRLDCNVDEAVKKRMLYLLNWQWTKEELEDYVAFDMKARKEFYDIDNRAFTLSKGDKQKQIKAADSLMAVIKAEKIDQASRFRVPNGLLLTVAQLGFVEARPILVQALRDSVHYSTVDVQLALARLGDENMQQKVISEAAYSPLLSGRAWIDDFEKRGRKLAFVASQESIYQLQTWLDSSKMFASKSNGVVDTKSAAIVISYLSLLLLNNDFQELIRNFKAPYGDDYDQVNDQMIAACKNWLIKNKGKYKVNKDFSTY